MNVHERLAGYGVEFDPQLVDRLAEVSDYQKNHTFIEFFDSINMPEPVLIPAGRKQQEIVDIVPSCDYDETHTRVMHLSMANNLNNRELYMVATVFSADPTTRLIAVGNPSAPGYKAGILSLTDARKVYKGDLGPTVEPTLAYMQSQGIATAEHYGYSYGADKAQVAATLAPGYDQDVLQTKVIEPTAVTNRGRFHVPSFISLSQDFNATGDHLRPYVDGNELPAFRAARDTSPRIAAYILGLGRITNIATASALATDLFETRTAQALDAQDDMETTIIWGSESELATDALMRPLIGRLQDEFGSDVVHGIVLPNQYHALANDVHLQAALYAS